MQKNLHDKQSWLYNFQPILVILSELSLQKVA